MESLRSPRIAGRRFRLHWIVQAGTQITEEYVFHVDGSMSFARVDNGKRPDFGKLAQYGALDVADGVCLVSFMDPEGRTLSFAMNFDDHRAQGFSALGANWTPVQGRFEEMSKERSTERTVAA